MATVNIFSVNMGTVAAQGVEAPVYTQAFEAGSEEADLYLTPNPYGFDLFSSHVVSSSAPAPIPTPTQASCQPIRMATSIQNRFLPPSNLPPTANQASASVSQRPKQQIITA
ncbi:hypothetical protein DSO57_1013988 [Entomophthora muscae]|uniref:Uncharacterized protein n=1 Tax=Entomophthora muscae TaxID=34485 RepID=A0ACC2TSP4_9FUNG|nr:hypothetical protein DSO57_1013988 [Entomophthora muscae]